MNLMDSRYKWRTDSGHNTGCLTCYSNYGRTGFNKAKDGYLYVVYSWELDAWKAGVTNDLARRLKELAQTGFDVDLAAFLKNTGDYIAKLEKELKQILADSGAVSLKAAGEDQLFNGGYTESWTAASHTPAGVVRGDCQAFLNHLLTEQRLRDLAPRLTCALTHRNCLLPGVQLAPLTAL